MSQSQAYIRAVMCCCAAERFYDAREYEAAWAVAIEAVRISVHELDDIYEALDITQRTNDVLQRGLAK